LHARGRPRPLWQRLLEWLSIPLEREL
jgi:hypothetical protein